MKRKPESHPAIHYKPCPDLRAWAELQLPAVQARLQQLEIIHEELYTAWLNGPVPRPPQPAVNPQANVLRKRCAELAAIIRDNT